MGNTKSVKSDDWNNLHRITGLSVPELKALHKEFFVAFPDGKMKKREYLEINAHGKHSEEFISLMFDSFDRDKNGYIDFSEYAMVIGIKKNGSLDDKVKLAFNMFDIDGNGTIEYEEMIRMLTSLFRMIASKTPNCTPELIMKMEDQARERVKKIFEEMDQNGDGVLTFEEFRTGCEKDTEISRALLNVSTL